jgi:hypothetical protein
MNEDEAVLDRLLYPFSYIARPRAPVGAVENPDARGQWPSRSGSRYGFPRFGNADTRNVVQRNASNSQWR